MHNFFSIVMFKCWYTAMKDENQGKDITEQKS